MIKLSAVFELAQKMNLTVLSFFCPLSVLIYGFLSHRAKPWQIFRKFVLRRMSGFLVSIELAKTGFELTTSWWWCHGAANWSANMTTGRDKVFNFMGGRAQHRGGIHASLPVVPGSILDTPEKSVRFSSAVPQGKSWCLEKWTILDGPPKSVN